MHDLKKCINNVHTNQPFPGKSDDFGDRLAYEAWQKKEIKQLSELLKTLTLLDPNLSMNNDQESSILNGSRASYAQDSKVNYNNNNNESHNITYNITKYKMVIII